VTAHAEDGATLLTLVAESVRRWPDRTAVDHEARTFTYAELELGRIVWLALW